MFRTSLLLAIMIVLTSARNKIDDDKAKIDELNLTLKISNNPHE